MTEQSMIFTRGMTLPDAFSEGQIFAYSGMDGENLYRQDFCGALTGEPGEIRFSGVLLRFTESSPVYDVVLPDLIAARDGEILVTFADAQTIVGCSDTMPALRAEGEDYAPGDRTVRDGAFAYALASEQADGGVRFAFCRRADEKTAHDDAQAALLSDAQAFADQVIDWYQDCPVSPDPRFEKLWYKCLSVSRVNVHSARDGFAHAFTTPLRQPIRDTRLWDICFHVPAMAHIAPSFAKQAVLALLENQRADGSVAHRMRARTDVFDVSQPPMLCAAIWSLFEMTEDYDLLRQTLEPLQRYLQWELKNHRAPSGLMTWSLMNAEGAADPLGVKNLMQQNPAEPLEAVDYSVFTATEFGCMQQIYMALGDHMSALHMENMQFEMFNRINARLWDEQMHCYFDRARNGEFRRIVTSASFLPLFAGACDPRQAMRLSAHLKPLLDYRFPIPSAVNENGKPFPDDLRRSGVNLHYNFFVYVGLERYGFGQYASVLRKKTLDGVGKQFRDSGRLFDLYDPSGGDPLQPDAPVCDSNRSASFIQLFLRG